MRARLIRAIYRKELLELARDRRTLISMVAMPVLVIPLLMVVTTKVIEMTMSKAERDSKTLTVGTRLTNQSVRDALAAAGFQLAERDNLPALIENKSIIAGIEERAGTPPSFKVYSDNSNPTSGTTSSRIREVLDSVKNNLVKARLAERGIDAAMLTPFAVERVNVAPPKKMAGMAWGMLGYVMLLMMFSGGMYPVLDMTAGEKERRTLESFLATPAWRSEIVMGKMLAAMTAILLNASLTLTSLALSIRFFRTSGGSAQLREMMGTVPLDLNGVMLLLVTLIPVCVLAAAVMMAIAMLARSFKEGQSYLTPLILLVLFPAMLGGLPALELTPSLAMIPIFNASQLIRGIILGEFSRTAFAITFASNLVYAAIALVVAKRRFENETVLFRT